MGTDFTCTANISAFSFFSVFPTLPTQTGCKETQNDMGKKGCKLVGEELKQFTGQDTLNSGLCYNYPI